MPSVWGSPSPLKAPGNYPVGGVVFAPTISSAIKYSFQNVISNAVLLLGKFYHGPISESPWTKKNIWEIKIQKEKGFAATNGKEDSGDGYKSLYQSQKPIWIAPSGLDPAQVFLTTTAFSHPSFSKKNQARQCSRERQLQKRMDELELTMNPTLASTRNWLSKSESRSRPGSFRSFNSTSNRKGAISPQNTSRLARYFI
jgi:hypothetical protein